MQPSPSINMLIFSHWSFHVNLTNMNDSSLCHAWIENTPETASLKVLVQASGTDRKTTLALLSPFTREVTQSCQGCQRLLTGSKKHLHGPERSCRSIIMNIIRGTEVRVITNGSSPTVWREVEGWAADHMRLTTPRPRQGRVREVPVCLTVFSTLFEFPMTAVTKCHNRWFKTT